MRGWLLLLECVLFAVGSTVLMRREKMFGLYFFALWVYVIFAQIGYAYVPELSAGIAAYFGEEIIDTVTLFVICSSVCLFIVLRYFSQAIIRVGQRLTSLFLVTDVEGPSFAQDLAIGVLSVAFLTEAVALVSNFSTISWQTAQLEDVFSATPLIGLLILIVKASVGTNIAMYTVMRERGYRNTVWSLRALLTLSFAMFIIVTFKLGNRTDSVALLLGLAIYEINRIQFQRKHFIRLAGVAVTLFLYLNMLEAVRSLGASEEKDFVAALLVKDYFSGAHVLFAAIYFEAITPLQVLQSNAGNALMGLGQPYLQAGVMDLFAPGVATRGASYGFYPLTEGYLAAGFAGFLYNGIVLGFLLSAWRSVATTNSKRFNQFLLAILGSMSVNLVRGQSSYFIKYLYTFVLPGALIYLALSRQKVRAAFIIEVTYGDTDKVSVTNPSR